MYFFKCQRNLLVVLAAVAAGGCAAMPYGVVMTRQQRSTMPEDYEVAIIAVDGKMIATDQKRQKLAPGPHLLQMASTKAGLHAKVTYQPVAVRVEPCMQYEFVARHEGRLSNRSWYPVLVSESQIAACVVDPE